jgi:hypothetical protein
MAEKKKIVVVETCSGHLSEAKRLVEESGADTGLILEFQGHCGAPQPRGTTSSRTVVGYSKDYADAYERIFEKKSEIKQ